MEYSSTYQHSRSMGRAFLHIMMYKLQTPIFYQNNEILAHLQVTLRPGRDGPRHTNTNHVESSSITWHTSIRQMEYARTHQQVHGQSFASWCVGCWSLHSDKAMRFWLIHRPYCGLEGMDEGPMHINHPKRYIINNQYKSFRKIVHHLTYISTRQMEYTSTHQEIHGQSFTLGYGSRWALHYAKIWDFGTSTYQSEAKKGWI